MSQATVSAVSLGLCEHCNALLSFENMPADAIDATWKCHKCGREVSHLSFGYDHGKRGAKKKKWVGPDGAWMTEKPEEAFDLDCYYVLPYSLTKDVWLI